MGAPAVGLSPANGRWGALLALVGPSGSGKTSSLRAALGYAERSGSTALYIDLRQAREVWQVDDFYGWLTRTIADGLGVGADRSTKRSRPAARVLWADTMQRLISKKTSRVLLAFDHFESIADNCAHELISDLREIQDKSGDDPAWERFRFIIAGKVSVFQLRRRAASPNLQFEVMCLPAFDAPTADVDTRRHFEGTGREISPEAIQAIACATCGEPAFLTLLAHYLPSGGIEREHVDDAIDLAARDAMRHVELWGPATLYLIDAQFRSRADDLLDSRPATWCDGAVDVDPYQLAGAFVIGDPVRHQARFRNALVRHTLRALRAHRASAPDAATDSTAVVALYRRCTVAETLPDLLDGLAAAWQQLMRVPGTPALILKETLETRRFLVGHSAIKVEQKRVSLMPLLEISADQMQLRVVRDEERWRVDAVQANHVEAGVRMICGDEFVPTVSIRESLRLWGLFLKPLEGTLQTAALQALGRAALQGRLPHGGKRVFVSSTSRDLKEHRQAVMEQIVRRDLLFRGMEHFGASADRVTDRIIDAVREADIYVGIFGARYGSIDRKSGISMTELEFNEAEVRGIPLLLYVLKPSAEVPHSSMESEPRALRKLQTLMARVREKVVYEFADPTDLGRQVYQDLGKYA